MRREKIHDRNIEFFCKAEYFFRMFWSESSYWCGDAYNRQIVSLSYSIDISWIITIEFWEVQRKIDTITIRGFGYLKYMIESITSEWASREKKHFLRSEKMEKRPLYDHIIFLWKIQIFTLLLFISDAVDPIFGKSNFFMIKYILDRGFILCESCISTFKFEKDDFPESPLRKPIEYDIVTTLSDKEHILWCVWKIRKCWKDFFIEFSEDLIFRSPYSCFSYMFLFGCCYYPHKCHTDKKSEQATSDECRDIHEWENKV